MSELQKEGGKLHLKIDEEFRSLIPPLTADEYQQLKENILKDGCRDALVIWNDTIIDGHNRYQICTENGIEFKTVEMEFTDRDDAKAWIIKNQFGRRNLQSFVRGELALKLKPILAKQAKERQGTRNDLNIVQKSAPSESIKTRDELATIAGTSHDTISKVEKILEKGTPEQIQRARQGGKGNSVNAIYQEIKEQTETRKCNICGNVKPLSEFFKGTYECKDCRRAKKSTGLTSDKMRELNEKYPDELINSYYEEMRNHDTPSDEIVASSRSAFATELSELLHEFNLSINKFLFSENLLKGEIFLKAELEETISNLSKIKEFLRED